MNGSSNPNDPSSESIASKSKSPDVGGNCHEYDGYTVYYDGDGTFSYAFMATMENGEARRFRIVVEE